MSAFLYVEGGAGDSKELDIRCREGFRKLLENCGFNRHLPRIVACGGRGRVYDQFVTAHSTKTGTCVAMWIDSEEPLDDLNTPWTHLKDLDHWERPPGATDDQVLFMTTCMETWIVADRETLKKHYGKDLQQNALPPLEKLENRERHEVQDKLAHATRNCKNAYAKGKRSFAILGLLNPATLEERLPSFARAKNILNRGCYESFCKLLMENQ